jgi:hypothetical protein
MLFAALKAYLIVSPLVLLLNLLPVPLLKWPANVAMAVWGLGLFIAYTFFV